MTIPNYTVIYDACVLYPNTLRDLLMELALTNLYKARWTEDIHQEWIKNLSRNRADISKEKLYRLRDLMNKSVPNCLVTNYQKLIEQLNLPDPNDRHVLAAAIQAQAKIIVTANLKDFPQSQLEKYNIEAQHQDTFVSNLIDLYLVEAIEAVRKCHQRRKNPPCSFDEYLIQLQKQQLNLSVSKIIAIALNN